MPPRKWKSVSIPEDILTRIKEIIKNYPELGYRSVSDFIIAAIKAHPDYKLADELTRFEHFNVYENHVTIWDKKLNRLVDVYFSEIKPPYVMCSLCERSDCEHVKFALSIPKVVEALTKRGWKIDKEEGKVLHVPS